MLESNRSEKISVFLEAALKMQTIHPVHQIFDDIYNIICKYDVPPHTDREFVFDCMISYYVKFEEYEKCAKLLKCKLNKITNKIIIPDDIGIDELKVLYLLGFHISTETNHATQSEIKEFEYIVKNQNFSHK
jgi:hypothetical protein